MGVCLEPPQFVTGLARVRITLPVPEPHRARLRSIRQGDVPLADVLDAITSTEAQIRLQSLEGPLLERLGWVSIRSGIEKRHGVAGPSLSLEGRHDTEPLSARKGSPG